MKATFLGQGFQENEHRPAGEFLVKFLQEQGFHSFTGISAFASKSGVSEMAPYFQEAKAHFECMNLIVGIDEKGTSKEALEELLKLDIPCYVFHYQGGSIFHPKIYFFEGVEKSKLILGSSNLTRRGLWSNVEASVLLETGSDDPEGKKLFDDFKNFFKDLLELTDPNLFSLTSDLIAWLVEQKMVPTEQERKESETGATASTQPVKDDLFPKRKILYPPAWFLKKQRRQPPEKQPDEKAAFLPARKGKLVWVRTKLPASSVQAAGANTNPTGGLRLVQDDFEVDGKVINQTTYFRQKVFGHFPWQQIRASPFVEAATVEFDIIILGEMVGRYELQVRHKPSGEAGQHNYTTSVSWGNAGEKIRQANLTGRRLELYAPRKGESVFRIEIK